MPAAVEAAARFRYSIIHDAISEVPCKPGLHTFPIDFTFTAYSMASLVMPAIYW